MKYKFTVHELARARRGAGNAALLAITTYDGKLYRLPIDLLEYLAIDEVRNGAIAPFSPFEQLARTFKLFQARLMSVTVADIYAGGYLATVDLECFGRTGRTVFRAGTAIALALQFGTETFINEEIVPRLCPVNYRGPIPFENMLAVNAARRLL
ncbi:MAG TPA: hypothetical protein VMC43_04025 [Candidatus Paceibacterota bacterium]|nr:hypothetical protein [Candidatus Paceibacterota bacterium]